MKIFSSFKSILILLALALTSCNSQKTTTFWVNSYKKDCEGVEKMQCLLVSEGDTLENAKWAYFYNNIDNFEFKPGVFQKIQVSEKHLNQKNTPADASTIKYSLIKVLEEVKDDRLSINDIWVATAIHKKNIDNINLPRLEIHIAKMSILGIDGCNNFSGNINELSNTKISFGPIASTRKMCDNIEVSNSFNSSLSKTVSYKKEGLKLYFFDKDGNEIIAFKKID